MSWDEAKDAIVLGLGGSAVGILGYMAHLLFDIKVKVETLLEHRDDQKDVNRDFEDRLRELENPSQ